MFDSTQEKGAEAKKIVAFDFVGITKAMLHTLTEKDSTIIKPISNGRFAKDANDWCWWHGAVSEKLKSLHEEGYLVVILSNQSGISLRNSGGPKIKADRFIQFKQKAGAVFNSLNIPISIYAATEKDRFRKPMTGMWKEFLKDQKVESVDLSKSVFVGDAGGRIAGTFNGQKYKADFACSDRCVNDLLTWMC
jgi:bifunctional polynucleotide phosphatase/kinase